MDPVTLGILGIVVIGILGLLVGVFVIRAWIRTLKLMMKLAFYGFVALCLAGLAGAGVAYYLYGDAIRAFLAA